MNGHLTTLSDAHRRARGKVEPVKYWEIIADRLHAEGWSYGIAEHLTKHGFLFCVDAHRDGKRFIVKTDDLLTAFISLERDVIESKEANENKTRQNGISVVPLNAQRSF